LAQSYLVGDKVSDLVAGGAAGCKTILVRTGYGARVDAEAADAHWNLVRVAADLGDAVRHLLPQLIGARPKRSA
jgi:D-glycero-D-manno-heptose 1,7-bisphosphate phosphatase